MTKLLNWQLGFYFAKIIYFEKKGSAYLTVQRYPSDCLGMLCFEYLVHST